MPGKSNVFEAGLLDLVFLNTAFGGVGDTNGLQPSAVAGSLYVSLHTADPGEAGDQTTNEVSYTGYARIGVARSAGGWTRTGSSISPTANVDFGQATAGTFPITATHWGIGTLSSGAGKLLYKGAISGGNPVCAFTGKASTDEVTVPDQTFLVNDQVQFNAVEGLTLPTGIAEGTVYYIKTAAAPIYTLSTTAGGATLDITANGAGFAEKVSPITINLNTIPRLTTSSTIKEG